MSAASEQDISREISQREIYKNNNFSYFFYVNIIGIIVAILVYNFVAVPQKFKFPIPESGILVQ